MKCSASQVPNPGADAPFGGDHGPYLFTLAEIMASVLLGGPGKYTAGNIDRPKISAPKVALGWLTEVSVNISDVLYEVTDAGKAAALRDD